jgi:hypothetical protein
MTLICGLSLVLFLAVATLWIWSDQTVVERRWVGTAASGSTISASGAIEVDWGGPTVFDPPGDTPGVVWLLRPLAPAETLSTLHQNSILGFAVDQRQTPAGSVRSVFFPDWSLLILFSILPIYWILRTAGLLRQGSYCHNCHRSFDDKHHRCPNCGTVWV